MAGYSGTPLPKKLGIGEGTRFAVKSHPPGFTACLDPLPAGATQLHRVRAPLDTDDILRINLLPSGWVDSKVCGLRFNLRKELRSPRRSEC